MQDAQAHRLVVESLGIQPIHGNNLLPGADALTDVVLKVFDKNVGHPTRHLIRVLKQVNDRRPNEVDAAARDHVGSRHEFPQESADAARAAKPRGSVALEAVFRHLVVVQRP